MNKINSTQLNLSSKISTTLFSPKSSISHEYPITLKERLKMKNRGKISQLLTQYWNKSSQIQIQANQTHLNLIKYQKQHQNLQHDPQMISAKLRKLQNQAEVNRANMEERKPKSTNHYAIKNRKKKNQILTESYQNIYHKYVENHDETINQQSQSQLHLNQQRKSKQVSEKQESIPTSLYPQLKKHPLIVNYTLNKLSQKREEKKLKKQSVTNPIIRSEIMKQRRQNQKKKPLPVNPEILIDNHFSKYYSQEITKVPSTSQIHCSRLIQSQKELFCSLEKERSLSRQNRTRLKNKFNKIVLKINKSEAISARRLKNILGS